MFKTDRERIAPQIDREIALWYPSNGRHTDPAANRKKIEGEDALYRLRVGDYRILYQVKGRIPLVLVVGIGHRRDIYRYRRFGA